MSKKDSKTTQPCTLQSVRRSALEWWNKLPMYDMDKPCKRLLSNLHYGREPYSLTGREIQVMYERHYT